MNFNHSQTFSKVSAMKSAQSEILNCASSPKSTRVHFDEYFTNRQQQQINEDCNCNGKKSSVYQSPDERTPLISARRSSNSQVTYSAR